MEFYIPSPILIVKRGTRPPRHVVQFLGNSDASIPKTVASGGRYEIEQASQAILEPDTCR